MTRVQFPVSEFFLILILSPPFTLLLQVSLESYFIYKCNHLILVLNPLRIFIYIKKSILQLIYSSKNLNTANGHFFDILRLSFLFKESHNIFHNQSNISSSFKSLFTNHTKLKSKFKLRASLGTKLV